MDSLIDNLSTWVIGMLLWLAIIAAFGLLLLLTRASSGRRDWPVRRHTPAHRARVDYVSERGAERPPDPAYGDTWAEGDLQWWWNGEDWLDALGRRRGHFAP